MSSGERSRPQSPRQRDTRTKAVGAADGGRPNRGARLLLVSDSLVGAVTDVQDSARLGVALDVGAIRGLELAPALDCADARTLSGVRGRLLTSFHTGKKQCRRS